MNTKDIYLVELDPTKGSEIKKTRPCLIVSNDDIKVLPLKIVLPLIGHDKRHNKMWMVRIEPDEKNGLSKTSTIDPMHIRSVSHKRMIKKIGQLSQEDYEKTKEVLSLVLDFAWLFSHIKSPK